MHNCIICGRPMVKCQSDIGPTCLRNMKKGQSLRGANKTQVEKILIESIPDMFLKELLSESTENK